MMRYSFRIGGIELMTVKIITYDKPRGNETVF